MTNCAVSKSEHLDNQKTIEDSWNTNKILTDQFGKFVEGNQIAKVQMEALVFERFGKLYDEDIHLTKQETKVIVRELKDLSSRIKSGTISDVEMITLVPDAIHNRLPSSRKFLDQLNSAMNYERTSREFFAKQKKLVSEELKHAFIASGVNVGMLTNPVIKSLRDLEAKYAETTDQQIKNDYYKQIEELINSNDGKVIKDYTEALELPYSELNKPETLKKYSGHILNAVRNTRELLGRVDRNGKITGLGKVLTDGLDSVKRAALLRFTNQDSESHISASRSQNPRLYNFLKEVDAAKARIIEGIEQGGYMPHIGLDQVVRIKNQMGKLSNSVDETAYQALEQIGGPDGALNIDLSLPREARSRVETIKRFFSRDPIYVLEQYANDVVVFNRDAKVKVDYMNALKNLGKENNTQFIRQMRKYLQMQYERTTMGANQSDAQINKFTRMITGIETFKSMAFGIAGATRNFLGGGYYYASLVQNGRAKAKRLLDSTNLKDVINEVIQEQGFEFKEEGGAAIGEGLLPTGGVRTSDLRLKVLEDGSTVVEIQKEPGYWTVMDKAMQASLNKVLTFHRWGENALRKHMFTHAFALTYDSMISNQNFMRRPNADGIINDKTMAKQEQKARKMATMAGLKMIENWAFEYSIHHKAPIISGIATGKGTAFDRDGSEGKALGATTSLGSVFGQFLHYPMEFATSQFRALKRSKQMMAAGDTMIEKLYNQDSKNVLAFAGVSTLVHALSLAFNSDLKFLLENDTLNRVVALSEYFDEDLDKKQKEFNRGLIQEITGPFVQDIMFAANVSGIYSLPDEEWAKMILGYQDYYKLKGDDKMEAVMKRLMPTELFKWTHRIIPDVVVNGGGVSTLLMHEFGVYPRSWTKQQREKIGLKRKKRKKKGKNNDLLKLARDLRSIRGG